MLRSLGVRYVFVHPGDYDGASRADGHAGPHDPRVSRLRQIAKEAGLPQVTAFELQPWDAAADSRADRADRRARADRLRIGSARTALPNLFDAIGTRAGLPASAARTARAGCGAAGPPRRRRARGAANRRAIDGRLSAPAAHRGRGCRRTLALLYEARRTPSWPRRSFGTDAIRTSPSRCRTTTRSRSGSGRPPRRGRPGRFTSCVSGGMIRLEVFDEAFSLCRSCCHACWWRFP